MKPSKSIVGQSALGWLKSCVPWTAIDTARMRHRGMRRRVAIMVCASSLVVLGIFALSANPARAQNVVCAPGTHSTIGAYEVPNASYCAPDDIPEEADDRQADQDQQPEPVWETRWGAIAVGDGTYGAAASYHDEQGARLRALSECMGRGNGGPCQIKQVYFNQCAALAAGDGGSISYSAPTEERAQTMARTQCTARTLKCQIVYSGCSLPEQVN